MKSFFDRKAGIIRISYLPELPVSFARGIRDIFFLTQSRYGLCAPRIGTE